MNDESVSYFIPRILKVYFFLEMISIIRIFRLLDRRRLEGDQEVVEPETDSDRDEGHGEDDRDLAEDGALMGDLGGGLPLRGGGHEFVARQGEVDDVEVRGQAVTSAVRRVELVDLDLGGSPRLVGRRRGSGREGDDDVLKNENEEFCVIEKSITLSAVAQC